MYSSMVTLRTAARIGFAGVLVWYSRGRSLTADTAVDSAFALPCLS